MILFFIPPERTFRQTKEPCQIITAGTFLRRIGEPEERKDDRRICAKMAEWGKRQEWREALERDDWGTLDAIEREYRFIDCL